MARRDQSTARKVELVNELTKHRLHIKVKKRALVQQIALSSEHIKESINIPKILGNKIKSSFRNSPTNWFIASTIGGLIISKIFLGLMSSKSKNTSENGQIVRSNIFFTLIGMAARPLIKSYLMNKAKGYLSRKFLGPQEDYYEHDYPPYSDYDIR